VRVPVPLAVSDMYDTVDDVRTVTEDQILEAMRLLYRTAGLLVEPSGAVGLANVLARQEEFIGKGIALVLTGAHLTQTQLQKWVLE
jgi:threonine dehydratase